MKPLLALALCGLLASPWLLAQQPVVDFVDLALPNPRPSNPVDLTNDGVNPERLYVVERSGRIRIIDLTTRQITATLLDISGQIECCGETGLLGLTFHPDFANNGYFYVNYTAPLRPNPDGTSAPNNQGNLVATTTIERYTMSSPTATSVVANSGLVILEVDQPYGNHNAGDLVFGPDGLLYIPLGDGGSGNDPENRSQDNSTYLGKLLRIDVDNPSGGRNYGIPPGNPFVGDANVLDEIFATGLRNPFRASFDRATGDFYTADVGQNAWEEVDFIPAGSPGGQNFGWKPCEGDHPRGNTGATPCPNPAFTDPIFEYDRNAGRSITGGFVYNGQHADDLVGYYVCADFVTANFFVFRRNPDGSITNAPTVNGGASDTPGVGSVSTFGEDLAGNLYVANLSSGRIFEVTTVLALPADLDQWTATAAGKRVELRWTTLHEEQTASWTLERSADGTTFTPLVELPAAGSSRSPRQYAYDDPNPLDGRSFYRLSRRDRDGTTEHYPLRDVLRFGGAEPRVFPNPTEGRFTVAIPERPAAGPVAVRLYATDGRLLYQRTREAAAGPLTLEHDVAELAAGSYRLVIEFAGREYARALVVR